jgi:hypothetical protein
VRFDIELILLTGVCIGLTYHEGGGRFYVFLDLVFLRVVLSWGPNETSGQGDVG